MSSLYGIYVFHKSENAHFYIRGDRLLFCQTYRSAFRIAQGIKEGPTHTNFQVRVVNTFTINRFTNLIYILIKVLANPTGRCP